MTGDVKSQGQNLNSFDWSAGIIFAQVYFFLNRKALLLIPMYCAQKYGGRRDRTQVAELRIRAAGHSKRPFVPLSLRR
jgi:hypothetical protein